jgi:dihydrodipicolinate synthase/N-acetylneuraminate lyase
MVADSSARGPQNDRFARISQRDVMEARMTELARGLYGILLTTYTERDEVDARDLETQADFVAATAQGIVWPVLASEFYLMSDQERAEHYAAVVAGSRRRVPFIAGVSATTTRAGRRR